MEIFRKKGFKIFFAFFAAFFMGVFGFGVINLFNGGKGNCDGREKRNLASRFFKNL